LRVEDLGLRFDDSYRSRRPRKAAAVAPKGWASPARYPCEPLKAYERVLLPGARWWQWVECGCRSLPKFFKVPSSAWCWAKPRVI